MFILFQSELVHIQIFGDEHEMFRILAADGENLVHKLVRMVAKGLEQMD